MEPGGSAFNSIDQLSAGGNVQLQFGVQQKFVPMNHSPIVAEIVGISSLVQNDHQILGALHPQFSWARAATAASPLRKEEARGRTV